LADHEQFVYWRDVVWEAFVPVTLARPGEGPFPSSVSLHSVGPIGLSVIDSQTQVVSRTNADIRRGSGGVYFLNLPLSEGTSAAQGGRAVGLRSHDFVLVDGEKPFRLSFARTFNQISLAIPHEQLDPLLACPLDATALRVRSDRGVGALASAAIRELVAQPRDLDRREARSLSDHLVGLVALAVRGLRKRPTSINPSLLLQAAFDEIDSSLADPCLTPTFVAMRLSVSVRYLHKLFAESGTSFGRHVLNRRLEGAKERLADPGWDRHSITDIAARHGICDPGYFARAFKQVYQMSPRDYRLQARRTRHLSGQLPLTLPRPKDRRLLASAVHPGPAHRLLSPPEARSSTAHSYIGCHG
jgi:AraC-like DNA-binding protein